jgi:hypothetical protein
MLRERCKECGRSKPILAIKQGDDFCSTECARRHYGTSFRERRRLVVLPGGEPQSAALTPRGTLAALYWRKTWRLSNGRKK